MNPNTTHGPHVMGLEGKRDPETLGLEVKKNVCFQGKRMPGFGQGHGGI